MDVMDSLVSEDSLVRLDATEKMVFQACKENLVNLDNLEMLGDKVTQDNLVLMDNLVRLVLLD